MVAAHAPVEAWAAFRAAAVLERHAELLAEAPTRSRQAQASLVVHQIPATLKRVEGHDGEFSGEMVVAHARLAQRRIARTRAQSYGAAAIGDAQHRFEEV